MAQGAWSLAACLSQPLCCASTSSPWVSCSTCSRRELGGVHAQHRAAHTRFSEQSAAGTEIPQGIVDLRVWLGRSAAWPALLGERTEVVSETPEDAVFVDGVGELVKVHVGE